MSWPAVDWGIVSTDVVSAFFCSVVVALVFYLAADHLFLKMLAHPSVQALVRVAQRFSKGDGGGILGWLGKQAKKLISE